MIPTRKQRIERIDALARVAAQVASITAIRDADCLAPELSRALVALQAAADDVVRISAAEVRFLDLARDIVEDRS